MRKVTKIALSVTGGVLVLGAIGSAAGSHSAAHAAPAPQVSHSAPANPAPAAPVTPAAPAQTPAPDTSIKGWFVNGGGSGYVTKMQADLSKVGTDCTTFANDPTNATDEAQLAADGTTLQTDARAMSDSFNTSAASPGHNVNNAPFSNALNEALSHYEGAGNALASLPQAGNTQAQIVLVQTATTQLQEGNSALSQATSLVS